MNERLSDLCDAALRTIAYNDHPSAAQIEQAWPALADVLKEIGIFARDMERTEALHCGDADKERRRIEQSTAAERLYGRLIDPPHAANIVPLATKGLGGIVVVEALRS